MLVFDADILLQYQVFDVELSLDDTLVVVSLQGFLILSHVGQ
jgi:hypothetical protein